VVRLSAAISLIAFLLISSIFTGCGPVESMTMSGASMEPTFHDGDRVSLMPVDRDPRRGDIVVFSSPTDPPITMAKRIVGLPTETIEIKDGHVLIDGAALEEPYVMEPPSYSFEPTVIPDNSYIILGDNRNHSKDSHNFGAVPMGNIQHIVEAK
jgi:signal peptidase I